MVLVALTGSIDSSINQILQTQPWFSSCSDDGKEPKSAITLMNLLMT
jgi:hypothetical protein